MAEQKTPEDTDKGYDEAVRTPWVTGSDAPRATGTDADEDEAEQGGLGGAPRANDPTELQNATDNEDSTGGA